MTIKNNVTRLLDSRKVSFNSFELPEEKLSAKEVADLLDVPVELVYKTIVVTRQYHGKPILAIVPGDREVDLKALASALNEKKVILASQRLAEEITGLKAGGISALALLNRGFQVVLDASAQEYANIFVSGGQLGLEIRLPLSALISLTNAKLAQISS
jgi:Cys-tRNA(Pro)/Cys-tRNA(Cys) deacylase